MKFLRKYADKELLAENEALRLRIAALKKMAAEAIADAQEHFQKSRHNWRTSVIVEAEKIAEQFIRLKKHQGETK